MLLPIKPICNASKVRRDGTSLIFIQYCFNSDHKTLLNTEIAIPPNYWHKKLNRIIETLPCKYGICDDLNKELQRQIRLVEDIISFALEHNLENPVSFVKRIFTPDLDINSLEINDTNTLKNLDCYDFKNQFLLYIESKRKKVAKATINVFHETLRYLEAFEIHRKKKITFDSFNLDLYDELVDFLTYDYISYR
jgi:hypothetical protein